MMQYRLRQPIKGAVVFTFIRSIYHLYPRSISTVLYRFPPTNTAIKIGICNCVYDYHTQGWSPGNNQRHCPFIASLELPARRPSPSTPPGSTSAPSVCSLRYLSVFITSFCVFTAVSVCIHNTLLCFHCCICRCS